MTRDGAKKMRQRKRNSIGDLVFNPKRKLRRWTGADDETRGDHDLALRVEYTGSPYHKRDPGDFGLTPPSAPRTDATLCDDANVTSKAQAEKLLKSGAQRGMVDSRTQSGFPSLIWTVDENGVAFEAQLENAGRGQYHGYPMPLSDPMRPLVLREYALREPPVQ